jgi:hypothetical protein
VVDGSKLQVRFRPKDNWVEIVSAPGIACAINDAWIKREATKLPAEAASPNENAVAAPPGPGK